MSLMGGYFCRPSFFFLCVVSVVFRCSYVVVVVIVVIPDPGHGTKIPICNVAPLFGTNYVWGYVIVPYLLGYSLESLQTVGR